MPISTVKYSMLFFLPRGLLGIIWQPQWNHILQPHPSLSRCQLRSCIEMGSQMMIKGICLYLDLGQTFPVKAPEHEDRFKSSYTANISVLLRCESINLDLDEVLTIPKWDFFFIFKKHTSFRFLLDLLHLPSPPQPAFYQDPFQSQKSYRYSGGQGERIKKEDENSLWMQILVEIPYYR